MKKTTDLGEITRVVTGIANLDKLIQGGIPKASIVLVIGAPGTGKTVLSLQYLATGVKAGEKCVCVAIEQSPENLKKQGRMFGLPVDDIIYISAEDIKYELGLGKKPQDVIEKITLILEQIKKLKPDRLVIDSLSSLLIEDGIKARLVVKMIMDGLRKLGVTVMMTGESLGGIYPDDVSPFLADGLIFLAAASVGEELNRTLEVKKMRHTNIKGAPRSFKFTKNGIVVES